MLVVHYLALCTKVTVMFEKNVEIPEGVNVSISERTVNVKAGKHENERTFTHPAVNFEVKDGNVVITSKGKNKAAKALVGTITAHIANMVKGVKTPFKYTLKIVQTHFPMTVKVKGDKLHIDNFFGERNPRIANIIGKTKVDVKGSDVIVTGPNKEHVGQTAANIERATSWNNGRDKRTFQDGLYLSERA